MLPLASWDAHHCGLPPTSEPSPTIRRHELHVSATTSPSQSQRLTISSRQIDRYLRVALCTHGTRAKSLRCRCCYCPPSAALSCCGIVALSQCCCGIHAQVSTRMSAVIAALADAKHPQQAALDASAAAKALSMLHQLLLCLCRNLCTCCHEPPSHCVEEYGTNIAVPSACLASTSAS